MTTDRKPVALFQNCAIVTGNKTVLSGIDLAVQPGDFWIIEGPTGSGKSSLMKVLSGSLTPASGYGEVAGIPLKPLPLSRKPELRRNLGIVTQHPLFIDNENCLANVSLPLRVRGTHAAECRARGIQALLDAGLPYAAKVRPSELSGGEQARLQIARALIHNPQLLLADEPFAHLDTESVELIESLLTFAHARGTAIVLTTHRPTQLATRARRAAIQDGRLIT